jgi:hypothetical protein
VKSAAAAPQRWFSATHDLVAKHCEIRRSGQRLNTPWLLSTDPSELSSPVVNPFGVNHAANVACLRISTIGGKMRLTHDRYFLKELMLEAIGIGKHALHETGEVVVNESLDRH